MIDPLNLSLLLQESPTLLWRALSSAFHEQNLSVHSELTYEALSGQSECKQVNDT